MPLIPSTVYGVFVYRHRRVVTHVSMKSQNPAVTFRQNIEDKLQFRNAIPCLMVERVIYCGIQYSLLWAVEIVYLLHICAVSLGICSGNGRVYLGMEK